MARGGHIISAIVGMSAAFVSAAVAVPASWVMLRCMTEDLRCVVNWNEH